MSSVKLKVVNNNFTTLLPIRNNILVLSLKEKICNLENLASSVSHLDLSKCNLFYVKKYQILENDKHLDYYKFEDYDEILFTIPNRISTTEQNEIVDNKITEKDIEEATKNLEGKNFKNINEKSKGSNERVLRSVLVTLIEISQNILCLNKTASDLFQYVQREISNHVDKVIVTPDQNLIHTLLEMGISREKACEALTESNNSLNNALNIIFSNQGLESNSNSGSLSQERLSKLSCRKKIIKTLSYIQRFFPNCIKKEMSSENVSESIKWIKDVNNELFVKPMPTKVILKLYRDYNRKFFRPHVAIRERLIDMGFEESTVNEALRINNNSEMAAVDSLLNPSSLINDSDDENDVEGLPLDHELIQTILANPDIHLGLLNIYSLLAFLNIVDNPKNFNHWLANPETKNILQQISNIATDFVSSFQ